MADTPSTEEIKKNTAEAKKSMEELKASLEEANVKQGEYNDALKKQQDLIDDINLKNAQGLKLEQEKLKVTKAIDEEQRKIDALNEKIREREREHMRDMLEAAGDEQLQNDLIADQQNDILKIKEDIAKVEEEKNNLLNEQELKQQKIIKNSKAMKKSQEELAESQEKFNDGLSKSQMQMGAMGSAAAAIFGNLGGGLGKFLNNIKKGKDLFGKDGVFGKKGKGSQGIKAMQGMFDGLAKKGGRFGKMFGGAASALGKFGKLAKFMRGPWGLLVLGVIEFGRAILTAAHSVDALSKEIAGATGFASQFHDELIDGAVAGNMAGIGFKEMKDSIVDMATGMSTFLPENEATNTSLALTVSQLKKFGVSGSQSVAVMDHMQRAMGLNAQQSSDLTANIARMGKEVGITAKKAIGDFIKAQSRLAIFGKQNIQVFKELQAQAKATGMSIDSLTSSVKQFDKFDSAAESAANLNAVLGTQLSTLELMNATDSERIMIIKQQVQSSVGNFDSLDKFTKMHIAQAMGLKSVDEAQRVLNMSTAEYQRTLAGQQESADIQKELMDATEKLVPVMQQLKLMGMQIFLAFAPLIEMFAKLLHFITPFIPLIAKGAMVVVGLTSAFYALANVGVILAGGFALLANPITLTIAGITSLLALFGALYDQFTKKINPPFVRVFHFLSEGVDAMFSSLQKIFGPLAKVKNMFGGLFGTVKKDGDAIAGNKLEIATLAKMDTSKMVADFNKVKSALMEISTIEMDGFLAISTDGAQTSMAMGSENVFKNISEGKLTVDVKMPEMKIPDLLVKVFIGDEELRTMISQEITAQVGAAG